MSSSEILKVLAKALIWVEGTAYTGQDSLMIMQEYEMSGEENLQTRIYCRMICSLK